MRCPQLFLASLFLTACVPGRTTPGDVPTGFQAACGKPGSTVTLPGGRGLIRRSDCDLRGVILQSRGGGGVAVPSEGHGVGNSSGRTVTTRRNGDVAFEVTGQPGNQ